MLLRNGTQFCTGRSRFFDQAPGSEDQTAKVFVKVIPEALQEVIFAQLDTGAAWSMLDAEIAAAMSLLNGEGEAKRMSTRHGQYDGHLKRTWIDIIADEGQGESWGFEATVWVSPEWRWGNFLGYGGLLERIRFAIDPSDNFFYFGSIDAPPGY